MVDSWGSWDVLSMIFVSIQKITTHRMCSALSTDQQQQATKAAIYCRSSAGSLDRRQVFACPDKARSSYWSRRFVESPFLGLASTLA